MTQQVDSLISIGRATGSDRKQLILFWQRLDASLPGTSFPSFAAGKNKFYQQLAKQLTRMEHGFALIAWRDDQALGCICGHLYDKPESTVTPIGVIYNLWVESSARRLGVASMLASEAETQLRALGAKGLQVSWRQDPVAEYFWRSQGFSAYETLAGKTFDPTPEN